MASAHQVVAAYWAAAKNRDWLTFAELVSEQVVYEAPQTRKRVCGRAPFVRFNIEGFPGDWHLTVERIVGEGQHAASWVQFSDAGAHYPGLCFFNLDEDSRVAHITDFWPTPSEVPAARTHLVERY
jgi:predicted ester cyclase